MVLCSWHHMVFAAGITWSFAAGITWSFAAGITWSLQLVLCSWHHMVLCSWHPYPKPFSPPQLLNVLSYNLLRMELLKLREGFPVQQPSTPAIQGSILLVVRSEYAKTMASGLASHHSANVSLILYVCVWVCVCVCVCVCVLVCGCVYFELE